MEVICRWNPMWVAIYYNEIMKDSRREEGIKRFICQKDVTATDDQLKINIDHLHSNLAREREQAKTR